jgi:hypothetical protein
LAHVAGLPEHRLRGLRQRGRPVLHDLVGGEHPEDAEGHRHVDGRRDAQNGSSWATTEIAYRPSEDTIIATTIDPAVKENQAPMPASCPSPNPLERNLRMAPPDGYFAPSSANE